MRTEREAEVDSFLVRVLNTTDAALKEKPKVKLEKVSYKRKHEKVS